MSALKLLDGLISKIKHEPIAEKSVTVIYFPSHGRSGRGLALRLALHLGGICFEDRIVSRTEHMEQKENNERRWSGVPEMIIYAQNGDSQKIAQSSTCLRYAGSITGLYPNDNPIKCALIDEVMDSVEDVIINCFIPIMKAKEGKEREDLKNQLMNDEKGDKYGKLRLWFDKFELRLKENNEDRNNKNGYFVGSTLTIADLKVFAHFVNYVNGIFEKAFGIKSSIFTDNGYKRIQGFLDKLRNDNAKIKQFIDDYNERLNDFGTDELREKVRNKIYDGKILYSDV